jgi:hypothetical protein
MRHKLLSICLAVTLAFASFGAVGCKPNSNSNTANSNSNDNATVEKILRGLHYAVAGSGPLLSLLVSQGKLSQEKADFIKEDFKEEVKIVDTLKDDVRAATDTASKLAAALTAYRAHRAIYEKGHYGTRPEILAAAVLIDEVFAAVVRLYGGSVDNAPRASAPMSEAEQLAALEAKVEQINKAFEVK